METEKNNPKTEPEQKTTQANKQDTEGEANEPAPPPVIQPLNVEGREPKPAESYDKTDRKQDETFQSIAKQTEREKKQADALEKQTGFMEKQTDWMRRQALWTAVLTVLTLGVLVYHGRVMSWQLKSNVDEFRRSHRPWVSLVAQPVPDKDSIQYDKDDKLPSRMNVTFVLRNAGDSPAIATVIDTKLVSRNDWVTEEIKECTPEAFADIHKRFFGELIIPQLERTFTVKDVDRREGPPDRDIYLVGCISYIDDEFFKSRPGCFPYAMSFVGKFSTDERECNSVNPCFINGGWGNALHLDKPEDCPE